MIKQNKNALLPKSDEKYYFLVKIKKFRKYVCLFCISKVNILTFVSMIFDYEEHLTAHFWKSSYVYGEMQILYEYKKISMFKKFIFGKRFPILQAIWVVPILLQARRRKGTSHTKTHS